MAWIDTSQKKKKSYGQQIYEKLSMSLAFREM